MSYAEVYRRSIDDPEGFWRERAEELPWIEFPPTILDQDEKDRKSVV
jgi:propionyl-CoA synthetase